MFDLKSSYLIAFFNESVLFKLKKKTQRETASKSISWLFRKKFKNDAQITKI